jgi:hypothetical protein
VVELVDTRDLKSLGDSLAGSIPAARTTFCPRILPRCETGVLPLAEKEWVLLTDKHDNAIRIQVAQIRYYRAASTNGTTICLGGDGEGRIIINVQEPPYTIDGMLGINSHK